MPSRTNLLRVAFLACWGTALGVLASTIVSRFQPRAPSLHEQDFRFERKDGSPVEVSAQQPLVLPYAFADFDLWSEVELPDGGEVDLVLRLVEPVMRERGLEPFHARFTVARLSAAREGQPVRTREQALFDDDPEADVRGGIGIGAGLPATLTVTARGHRLEVSVAGRKLPSIETVDAHGEIAFVARNGTALVRRLEVIDVPRPLRLLPIGWCAILGAAVGAILAAARSRVRVVLGLLVIPSGAVIAGVVVFRHLLPETEPSTLASVCGACCTMPAAVLLVRGFGVVRSALSIVALLALLEFAARIEQPRLRPFEDPRLTAYFGEDSAIAPFDALARRMSARDAIHGVTALGERVVFLGGEAIYELDPDRAHWIAPVACARATQALGGRKLDGAVLSTVRSHTRQQIACFERYYRRSFAPRALVLTVPPWEDEPDVPASSLDALDGLPAEPRSVSVLLDLLRRAGGPRRAPGDPTALTRVTFEFIDRCHQQGTPLLLAVDRGLDPAFGAALVAEAKARAMPLLRLSPIEQPDAAIAEIGDGLADLLR